MTLVPDCDPALAKLRHLRNAPVVEAIIDVRVEARPDFQGEAVLPLREMLRGEFPKAEERRGVSFQVAFGGAASEQGLQDHGVNGVFLRSEDEKSVAQFRTDGFAFNRLAPYSSWHEIHPIALRLLTLYLDIARPQSIVRVAVRYINRLQIPTQRFAEYLTAPPRSVPGTSGPPGSFMEVLLSSEPDGAKINYTQALETNDSRGDISTVLIDVDAYNTDPCEPDASEVSARLSALHTLKNRVFFASVTDLATELYA